MQLYLSTVLFTLLASVLTLSPANETNINIIHKFDPTVEWVRPVDNNATREICYKGMDVGRDLAHFPGKDYDGDSEVCVCCNLSKLQKYCPPKPCNKGRFCHSHNIACCLQRLHCGMTWTEHGWSSKCKCQGEKQCLEAKLWQRPKDRQKWCGWP